MSALHRFFTEPWPWYVAGPAIGLFVPLLLLLGNKPFGMSACFRHLCAAIAPGDVAFFRYDWRRTGAWLLAFTAGIMAGAAIAAAVSPEAAAIADATRRDLAAAGLRDFAALVPADVFGLEALPGVRFWVFGIVGGLLVGFGASYAGGCTSGHAISGLANFQLPSLIAVTALFAAGAVTANFFVPWLLRLT